MYGKYGIPYEFIVYQGSTTLNPKTFKSMGFSLAVILHLTQWISQDEEDNNPCLTSEKVMKELGHWYSAECISSYGNVHAPLQLNCKHGFKFCWSWNNKAKRFNKEKKKLFLSLDPK